MDTQEGIKGRRSREREKRRLEEAVTEVSEAVNQTILRLQGCRNRILEVSFLSTCKSTKLITFYVIRCAKMGWKKVSKKNK